VDRNTLLWTIVVFFGASVLFGAIGNLTEDESDLLRIGLQALAGVVVVAALFVFVRKKTRR
jgi:membrane protein DedA with SNARE-associated domain